MKTEYAVLIGIVVFFVVIVGLVVLSQKSSGQINVVGRERVYQRWSGEWMGSYVSLQYMGSRSVTVTIRVDWGTSTTKVLQPSEVFRVYASAHRSSVVEWDGNKLIVDP